MVFPETMSGRVTSPGSPPPLPIAADVVCPTDRARAEREPPHAYDAPPAKRTRSSLVFRKEHEPSRDVSGRRARAVRTTIALHNVLRSDLRSFSALQRLDDRRLWAQTSPTIEARASATGTAALVPRRSPPPDSRRRRDPGEDRVQQFRDEQATNRTMAETKSRLQVRTVSERPCAGNG